MHTPKKSMEEAEPGSVIFTGDIDVRQRKGLPLRYEQVIARACRYPRSLARCRASLVAAMPLPSLSLTPTRTAFNGMILFGHTQEQDPPPKGVGWGAAGGVAMAVFRCSVFVALAWKYVTCPTACCARVGVRDDYAAILRTERAGSSFL